MRRESNPPTSNGRLGLGCEICGSMAFRWPPTGGLVAWCNILLRSRILVL